LTDPTLEISTAVCSRKFTRILQLPLFIVADGNNEHVRLESGGSELLRHNQLFEIYAAEFERQWENLRNGCLGVLRSTVVFCEIMIEINIRIVAEQQQLQDFKEAANSVFKDFYKKYQEFDK
jgi:hypothetical protein